MGLISRVSSRTYRKSKKKFYKLFLNTKQKKADRKKLSPKMPRKANSQKSATLEQDKLQENLEQIKSQVSSFKENTKDRTQKEKNPVESQKQDTRASKRNASDSSASESEEKEDPHHKVDFEIYGHCNKIQKTSEDGTITTRALYARLDRKNIEYDREEIKKRLKLMLEYELLENCLYGENKHNKRGYCYRKSKSGPKSKALKLGPLKKSLTDGFVVINPYRKISELMEEQLNETIQDMKNMTIDKE